MAEVKQALVPDIGGYNDVPVIEVLVAVGDTVRKDQGLVTLESDKASMEVPAPFAGVVREIKVKVGDTISEGAVVALIEAADSTTAEAAKPEAQGAIPPAASSQTSNTAKAAKPTDGAVAGAPASIDIAQAPLDPPSVSATAASANADFQRGVDPEMAGPRTPPVAFDAAAVAPDKIPHASPAVRVFARELGVDLARVQGTARGARIAREDVQAFVKSMLAGGAASGASTAGSGSGLSLIPWPKVDFARFGEIESQPLSKIKKISGANLARNWAMIPHVTQFDEADITQMEAFRKQLGEENKETRLTPLVFLIKAVVAALQQYPQFNASLDGENLILKKYFHIGIAVDTPDGLVVPVLRDCDRKGLLELSAELAELSKKAREKKLGPAEMAGGCFSISSLGGIGGNAFTPIINAPEVAILGVSRSAMKPVWNGATFEPRLMLPLSLSYDHRVVDGADAARFTGFLARVLGDLRRLLL